METNKKIKTTTKTEVITRLNSVGISVLPVKKSPKNGKYSGIVGNEGKKRVLNI